MTALTGSDSCSPADLAATRDGLHKVAEHLLAGALYAATGEIALAPSPGGFRTPAFGAGGTFLAVDGTDLVVGGEQGTRRTLLTTLRAAARFAGVTAGGPAQVYQLATPASPDEPLLIDPAAAHLLAEWNSLGARALRRFAVDIPGDKPSAVVLWPEHFDIGITAGAVDYGVSPGDARIAEPYVYASPHHGPPPGDPAFWNAPFGAARTFRQIGTVAEAAAFFHDSRARVLAGAAAIPTRRTP